MKNTTRRIFACFGFLSVLAASCGLPTRCAAQVTFTQSATNLFATGTNTVKKNATTNDAASFRIAVSNAWTAGSGGVMDLPTTVANSTVVYRGNYGTNLSKRLQMNSSVTMQNSTTGGNSFFPISNPNVTTTLANQSDFNFGLGLYDTNTGLPLAGEVITQIGVVMLSRTAVGYPMDLALTAGYSDGTTQTVKATIANGRGLDETFYGFRAPTGLAITNIRFQSFVTNTATPVADRIGWDDFGFITGASVVTPPPLIIGLSPLPYAIATASNGIQFQALTYESISTNNVTVILNSTNVSGSLIFSGSPTNYLVSYPGLVPNQTYTATITVTNSTGSASVTETFNTFTNSFTLYDSQGFTDDTLYPAGSLLAMTNGSIIWAPDLSEPGQIIDIGAPQGKILQRQNTGATRSDLLSFSPVSSGRIIVDFDAFVSTTTGRTLDIALAPTNVTGTLMASLLSWGQISGELAYFDNTNWIAVADLPSDWHHIKVIHYLSGAAAGKFDLLLNGTLVGQKISWRSAVPGSALGRFRIETANTGPVLEYGNIDNLVITAAPEDTNTFLPPQIVNLNPIKRAVIKPSDGISFNVTSGQAITGTNVTAILDGTDISNSLIVGGSATNLSVSYNLLTAGAHTLNLSAFNVAGTNTNSVTFIATDSAFTLYDSGGFADNTLYPLGALQLGGTNGSSWAPDTNNPGQIVDVGAPQGKELQRIQAGADAVDILAFPSIATGILTIDMDARASVIDSRTLDTCLLQETGSTMASFLGWGTVSNQFAYYNAPLVNWIALASPGTNWHHYTTINYMSGVNSRTFDVLVDGVAVGLKLPFRQTVSVGTPVGRLRVGAIRGTALGESGNIDNLVITAKPLSLPPTILSLTNVVNSGSTIAFSFTTQAGYTHSVQYKNALPSTNWTVLQTFIGNGSATNITSSILPSDVRYYRVQTTQ